MDSLCAFKCKRFRKTRHTVTFGIPITKLFLKGSDYGLIYATVLPFAVGTEENHENPESGYLVSQPRSELSTS
jgi:hypothetical protein